MTLLTESDEILYRNSDSETRCALRSDEFVERDRGRHYFVMSRSLQQNDWPATIMNRSSTLLVVAMMMAISISGLKALSLSSLDAQIPTASGSLKFSLAVEKGIPSGNYAAGTQVIVSASAPQVGAKFAGWKGDVAILANPFLATTTATIPFMAVTITATYSAPEENSSETPTQLEAH